MFSLPVFIVGNFLSSAVSCYQLLERVACDGRGNPNGRAEKRRNNKKYIQNAGCS
jgi:hypothetical protein